MVQDASSEEMTACWRGHNWDRRYCRGLRNKVVEELLSETVSPKESRPDSADHTYVLHTGALSMNQHGICSFELDSSGPMSLSRHPKASAFAPSSTVEQVAEAVVGSSRRITGAEFAALLVHGDTGLQAAAALRKELWKGEVSAEKSAIEAISKIIAKMGIGGSKKVPLKFLHIIPLKYKRSAIGYWVIGDRYSTSLSENTLGLVTLLAHHIEVAIANAILMKRLEHMTNTDPLTRLANRRRFHDELNIQLGNAQRDGEQLSLNLIDIDHFKDVNDRFGHPAGDDVLKQVAAILQLNVRGKYLVARYGGEEFVILMGKTHRRHGWAMAERIRHAISAEVLTFETGSLTCTVSLGVASFPEDASDMPQLIARTDRALYLAKRAGRNQTAILSRDGNSIIPEG